MTANLGSIVIAAHNEEAVIARTLALLHEVVDQGLVDVVVVCNGCTDRTAEVARNFTGVRVRELDHPSKTAALRHGDQIAMPGPRIYLDADVELTGAAAVATMVALTDGALAARPPHRFESSRASWVVRRWYAVREQLPSIATALWGAGCYALSVEGRTRFGEFPEIVADDLFIDALFLADEIRIVDTDPITVRTPRVTADLLRIMRRSYRTQSETAPDTGGIGLSPGQQSQSRDLMRLVRRDPARVLDVGIYLALIAVARAHAQVGAPPTWERDASSRQLG